MTIVKPIEATPEDKESDIEVCRQVLQILALIGDKWSVLIVDQLRDGSRRFSQLHQAVTGISQRMLTLNLRQLERDGIISRTVHASVPPRVDYALTELGTTLLDAVALLSKWATAHRLAIIEHRREHDEKLTHPQIE